MAKETVRYPDALVARIEAFVTDSSTFESKSEYHRFASEFLLSLLDADHDPSVLGYDEISADLREELSAVEPDHGQEDEPFLTTYIRVRRQLLHGEYDAARAIVDETYDVADREALLLDELIGHARQDSQRPVAVERYGTYTESPTGRQIGDTGSHTENGQTADAESRDEHATEVADESTESTESNQSIDTHPASEASVESDF